jgi:hypothetical protein
MIEETNAQPHRQPPAGSQSPPMIVSRRSRYGNLDWDRHKEEMRKLYLEGDQSLDETMRVLKEKHSFLAS